MILNIFRKKSKYGKILEAIIFAVIIAIFLFNVKYAMALTATGLASDIVLGPIGFAVMAVLSVIAYVLTAVIGLLITLVVQVLVQVAQYGNIINVPTVVEGWVIIRDLCNMLFILILLIIAFATILRVESYNYKKLLPKLLIMAILINFSRTIFGLLVDFSQVIMLTFVNSFREGGGWFIDAFQVNLWFSVKIKKSGDLAVTTWTTAVSIIAGVIAAVITLIVVSIMLAVLVIRIIMLWIYTIFSPLIFLGFAIPAIQKYTGRIWEDFTKQLVVGPMLAFFIWLALTTASLSSESLARQNLYTGAEVCVGVGSFFCQGSFQTFIIVIGLLVGGLMMAQQVGGAVGSVAGKGMDWAKKTALVPWRGVKASRDFVADKLQQKGIVDLNLARVWKGIKEKRADIKKKQYGEGMVAAAEKMREGPKYFKRTFGRTREWLAATATPGSAFEQLTTRAGWKRRVMGGKYAQNRIKDLAEERKQAKQEMENIKNGQKYKQAVEISEALLPKERQNLDNEQTQLTQEIEQLNDEIKSLAAEIETAKNNNDFTAERTATEKSDSLKNKLELKLSTFDANKKTLDKPSYNGFQIFDAKAIRTSLEAQISEKKKIVDAKNDQILNYKPIVDFEAIAMQGALEAEEMKKVDHIKDRDELASMLRDAMRTGDKTRFSAIALKLAKDGNENDGVLNNLGFESNAFGLQDMIKSISSREYENNKGETVKSSNYMGFSDQQAKALGMKISYAAEGVNHWGTARAFTMEDGRYKNSSRIYQAMASASEIAKMDPQQIAFRLNRLGYGGETPDGKFILNDFGLAILKAVGPKVAEQMGRFNPNAAARLSTPENIKLMVEVGVAPEFISKLQAKGRTPTILATKSVEEIEEMRKKEGKYFT